MRRLALALTFGTAMLAVNLPSGAAASAWHGRHSHRHAGFVHRHRPPSIFFGFGYHPYVIPYYYPYPYVIYPPPPPPPDDTWSSPPAEVPPSEGQQEGPSDEDAQASYGLVQLRGVPDGADVELDGRFWLRARDLDQRWLALPQGNHTLVVRTRDGAPLERQVEVAAGRMQVVRFDTRTKRRT